MVNYFEHVTYKSNEAVPGLRVRKIVPHNSCAVRISLKMGRGMAAGEQQERNLFANGVWIRPPPLHTHFWFSPTTRSSGTQYQTSEFKNWLCETLYKSTCKNLALKRVFLISIIFVIGAQPLSPRTSFENDRCSETNTWITFQNKNDIRKESAAIYLRAIIRTRCCRVEKVPEVRL